ncbi:MAG: hypothetical protein K2O95_01260 [Clostridia bacterium]|nr:hypothetical protein [Clostridia bacterium]
MEDEKDDVENTIRCTNCKYYNNLYSHYNGHFHKLPKGYCSSYKTVDKRYAKIIKNDLGCEFWEPVELRKNREIFCIGKILERIRETLDEIKQYLDEDKRL